MSNRKYSHRGATVLVALPAFVFSSVSAAAPAEPSLGEVVVTATRFEEATPKTAGNMFVLTREDIDRVPAANVPDLLSGLPGVNVLPLYGTFGIDSVVNLRGAGGVGTGSSNTLVLLNGQRLNPIDSGSIDWSLVPVTSIERIEIMPGSGTVLYGDRATGGVINIVTRKGVVGRTAQFGVGSHGLREVSAQAGWQSGAIDTNLHLQYGANNGWRRNSEQERYSLGGRVGIGQQDDLRGFVDFSVFGENLGMPGGLWRAEYDADPTKSRHPADRSDRQGFRIRPGVQMNLASGMVFEADLTFSKDERRGYSGVTNPVEQVRNLSRDFVSFSPKLRQAYQLGGVANKVTAGYDFYRGSTFSTTSPVGNQDYTQAAAQSSHALYLQNVSDLSENLFLTLGLRSQRLDQSASQSAYTTYYNSQSPAVSGRSNDSRNAYEAGLAYQTGGWRIYGRTGMVYRYPNTDELFGLDPLTYDPAFAINLRPQQGHTREVGTSLKTGAGIYTASLYQQDLKDEITSDPMGGNMNLAATKRQGMDLSARIALTERLRANVALTVQEAKVRGGPYAGYDVPMIPRVHGGAGLSWSTPQGVSYAARLNYVAKRRYSDDYASEAGYLDGYTTLDLSGAWQMHGWRIEAKLHNVTNKKYAAYGGYGFNATAYDTFYYPADLRTFRVTVRHDF